MQDDIKIGDIDLSPKQTQTTNQPQGNFEPLTPTQPTQSTGSFWDDAAEGGDFEDLRPGSYPVTIVSADIKEYKNGGRGFEVVTKLNEGGQQDWLYLTFEHANPNAVGMGKRDLKALFTNFGIPLAEDLNTMLSNLKTLAGKQAVLNITWTMKNDFKTKDALGNEAISNDYNPADANHHYVNKSLKPV